MDPCEPANDYYAYYSTPRAGQSTHVHSQSQSQAPASFARPSMSTSVATGPYASPTHAHPFSSLPNMYHNSSSSGEFHYLSPAARSTAGAPQPYHEPGLVSRGVPTAYRPEHGEASPSVASFHSQYRPPFHHESDLSLYSAAPYVTRDSRSLSSVSHEGRHMDIQSGEHYYGGGTPNHHFGTTVGVNSRFTVRQRTRLSPTESSSPRGDPHSISHTAGSHIPDSVASTPATPSRGDFPIGSGQEASSTTWRENSTEPSTPDDIAPSGYHIPTLSAPASAPISTLEDAGESFPLDTPFHEALRMKLLEVLNARWRRANEKEPESQMLLQFTEKVVDDNTEKFRCLFWADGVQCDKRISRSDRILEHLRRHVGIRPYTCNCKSEGCPGVFPSKAAMYQHQKNVEPVQCQKCGAQVLRQNLARHQRAQRCQRPEEAMTFGDGY